MVTNPSSNARRRLWALILLSIPITGGALAYRHFWYARPIGSGPAGPAVQREPFNQVWTNRKVVLIGIGDSVTAGFGAPPEHGYFDRLLKNPTDEFSDMQGLCLATVLPNLTATNIAVSGSNVIEHLELLLPKLETHDADAFGIIVLTTGGNDIVHNYGRTPPREGAMYGASLEQAVPWIKNFEQRLDQIVDGIVTRFPGGCRIFLANIYDPTDGVGDAEHAGLPAWPDGLKIIDAYNATIARCADRYEAVHLVNIHDEFLGHGIHCVQFWNSHYRPGDPRYWYFDNLEDPNDRGYDAIRRLFLIEMAKVLPPLLSAVSKAER